MATDIQLLQGEVTEEGSKEPSKQDRDVENLLRGFLMALIDEQQGKRPC